MPVWCFGACQKRNGPVRNTVQWYYNLQLRFCSREILLRNTEPVTNHPLLPTSFLSIFSSHQFLITKSSLIYKVDYTKGTVTFVSMSEEWHKVMVL